ncbi:hypothetical protein HYH02_004771 [Chlamydomonas schloesseri]|uniref:Uncharacterized protein n=1 Tax=Chlamydomonas schloesseri TaxID=2026947 RepID=A0A836B826_9CHLO|nr:hypothetical protein HYH02_004771 [Chlamydomonas schloesseri]|eukprot:KAG2450260.1 hypothetical protein HYH02_004771 [Chlamydomonas schloesseri]
MLASRIASHALAATSGSARGSWLGLAAQQWRAVSGSAGAAADASAQETAASAAAAAAVPSLTAAQRAKLPALLALARRPTSAARRLGSLTALSATYRDMSLALSALAAQQAGLDPLAPADANDQRWAQLQLQKQQQQQQQQEAAVAAAQVSGGGGAQGQLAASAAAGGSVAGLGPDAEEPLGGHLPLLDVTDAAVSGGDAFAVDGIRPAPEEPVLSPAHMDKVSAWAALAPPHLEASTPLQTAVHLWPPSEATYPTYVDFDAALRLLAHHTSRKRLRLGRRLLRRQDKYQLKTWEHHSGEA